MSEQEGGMPGTEIHWPVRFAPENSPVHVVNRLYMAAAPAAVWASLIEAKRWPRWYANSSNVRIEDDRDDLAAGSRFRWRTFGVTLDSVVQEFETAERISWLATAPGIQAYHAWLIVPQDGGCQVITEETQHGLLARAGRVLFPGRMEHWHQKWLEGLAEQAKAP